MKSHHGCLSTLPGKLTQTITQITHCHVSAIDAYPLQVRFLTVPGSYMGETFPPGTGNVDAIVPSTSDFTGTGAAIMTTTVTQGADEMGGGFTLSFDGEATEILQYTADETSVEASLEVRNWGLPGVEYNSRSRHGLRPTPVNRVISLTRGLTFFVKFKRPLQTG